MKHKTTHPKGKPLNDEPSDMVLNYRDMDVHRKEANATALVDNTFEMNEACTRLGLSLSKFTEFHHRITNGKVTIDFYPVSRKYHNISTQKRGTVHHNLEGFLKIGFGL